MARLVRAIHPASGPVMGVQHPPRPTVDRPHRAGDDGVKGSSKEDTDRATLTPPGGA